MADAADPSVDAIPLLSLIVPVYGVEDYIGYCLDSIVGADGFTRLCELVIVDDGSTDDSMAIAQDRCASLPNVTILSQANGGLSAARNAGLRHARGRYVWFVDSDDEICPDALTVLERCIARSAPDIIAFEFETIGGTLDRAPYIAVYDQALDPIAFMVSGRPPSPVQFYAFSRDMIDRKQLLFQPGIYHEDALFTPLALTAASSIVRLPDTCYRYRFAAGLDHGAQPSRQNLADMLFIANTLRERAHASPPSSPTKKALSREVGFALSAARHYATRTPTHERQRTTSLAQLLTLGRGFRHFTGRAFVNYVRLLEIATRDELGRTRT